MTTSLFRIGDHCQVGDGAHASLRRVSDGIPYLTAKHLKDGKIDLENAFRIEEATFEKHFRRDSKALTLPMEGDVIFGIIGSLGQAYRVKSGDRFGLSSSIAILRPNLSRLDPDYLYYWVTGPMFQQAIYSIKGGVAQSYVSLEMIRSLPLRLPPMQTQRRIAYILSAYDDLIENNTRRIGILEEMARRIYEEWFVRFRFPGHENVRMVESELGPVPEGWAYYRLDELAEIRGGKQLDKQQIKGAGRYPVFGGNGIQGYSERSTHNGFVIAFGRVGAYCGSIHWSLTGAWLNNNSSSIVPNVHPELVLQHLLHFDFGHLRGGAAQPFISNSALCGARFVSPQKDIADRFVKILRPMRELQARLVRANGNLRSTRDMLLPELISGELDVSSLPEPEAAVA